MNGHQNLIVTIKAPTLVGPLRVVTAYALRRTPENQKALNAKAQSIRPETPKHPIAETPTPEAVNPKHENMSCNIGASIITYTISGTPHSQYNYRKIYRKKKLF